MRIVVKIGSNLLVGKDGKIDETYIDSLARRASAAIEEGNRVVMVSSGARAGGYGLLEVKGASISEKQALCAMGQIELMRIYSEKFGKYGKKIAQLLLTRDDFTNRKRFLNFRNTLISLERFGAVPIVNENDTVAVDEIKVGDNDTLSSYVAMGWNADLLLLLTVVDGVMDENGKIIEVYEKGSSIMKMEGTSWGTGGMATKIAAAKTAAKAGIKAFIANGRSDSLVSILKGERAGTEFQIQRKPRAKKAWIAFMSKVHGKIEVDPGAFEALLQGKSLLPVGIRRTEGKFDQGDTIEITCGTKVVGRGISNYSSSEIEELLPTDRRGLEEVCHADNLILRTRKNLS